MKNTIKECQFCADERGINIGLSQTIEAVPIKPASLSWREKTIEWASRWNERRVTRRLLRRLSDNQLQDIGLTRRDVHEQYERKVWPHWPK